MKYLPFIWANLWRKPIRTLFTLVSLIFSFILLGLVFGLDEDLRQMTGSARADRIHTTTRFAGKLWLAQMDQISHMRDVAAIGALDGIEGYYQRAGNNLAIMMVDSGMWKVLPELLPTRQESQMLASRREGVMVSSLLAAKYRLKTGGDLTVVSSGTPTANASNVWKFKVLGVVPDVPMMPVGFAVGNYDYLEQVRAPADRGAVRQLWLIAKNVEDVDALIHEIDMRFFGSAVPTRSVSEKILIQNTAGALSDAALALAIVAVIGVVMIMFLTANALRHSIRERTTELAVLKTLGFSNMEILSLVFIEAALPCVAGGLLGLGIAAGTSVVMPLILPTGVTLPPPRIDIEVVGLGIGAALLVALTASLTPVLRITRLDVATALASH